MQLGFEQFMAEVFTSPHYKPAGPENPFESEEYDRFVESMVPHCHCRESNRPCDGVLAGGICDDIKDEPESEDDDGCDECGRSQNLCNCFP